MKKYLCFFLTVLIFFSSFALEKTYSQTLLKGGVTAVIEKDRDLNVNLSTPINFYFSQAGDKVVAIVKEDISIGDSFYIPSGSRIEGVITAINEPRHFGQNGSFEIEFNEIVTPDNLTIPIVASVSTDTKGKEEKVADILSYDAALVAYGTFNGLIAGLQYGGLPLAIASHGISLLAGAGVGATTGVIGSVLRKGKVPVVLTNSPNTKVALKSNLYVFGELPKIDKAKIKNQETRIEEYKGFRFFPEVKNDEIELVINKIKNEHSKTYGDYLVLEFDLKNNSRRTVSFSDLVLLNKSSLEMLHPDLFLSGNEALKTVKPFDEISASLAFLVSQKKKHDYYLVLVDPLDGKEVVKVPLKGFRIED